MFWITLVVLCLAAILFAIWPLWRNSRRLTPAVSTIIVLIAGFSAGLYNYIGNPDVTSGRADAESSLPGMQEAVSALEARLQSNPDDIGGWKMLGRTQMTLRDFVGAADSYEKAMDLEEAKVAQTLVDLAIAIMNRDQVPAQGRVASLLDSALAIEPNNPAALFYSGLAAAERGDTDTAARRWEILLGLNPPENIRGMLVQRIAEWRGESPPAAIPGAAAAPATDDSAPDDAVVSARIALSAEAVAAISTDANVFIIARDPAAPSPPIAVTRRLLSELPTVVSLSDAQSMVEGRNLSAFAELEILARVSLSGGPAAASGDWFGSRLVRPAENKSISLTIDQQVP